MKSKVNKNFFLCFVIYISILLTLTSTWTNNILHIPAFVNKVNTILMYIPFALVIVVKLIQDVKEKRNIRGMPIECIYYLFALYYAVITGYRFLTGMEVKENLYYSIIFFGTIAFYLLLRSKKIRVSKSDLVANLLWVDLFLVLYRLCYCLIGTHFFQYPPININITSGAVALLTPFVGNWLINEGASKRDRILCWTALCGNLVVILTTGARAIFYLVVTVVVAILVFNLNNRKGILRAMASLLLGCLVVLILVLGDVGDVRYSIYRQTGLSLETMDFFGSNRHEPDGSTEPIVTEPIVTEPISTDDSEDALKHEAEEQASRSDYMRKYLIQCGIDQIKMNPLVGTGDVMYEYQLGNYRTIQSSHNFVIEVLVCYGTIGLVMIAVLFIALVIDTKLFVKSTRGARKHKEVLALTILFYFAFGFVQPVVFDVLICPLFVVIVAACREVLLEENIEGHE